MEKSTNQYYTVTTETTNVNISEGDNTVTITNKQKTGYIEIYKTDADDSSIKLSNIKFGIYDTSNNLIETITTNSNGYAKSSALSLSKKYVVKELETQDDYVLNANTWNVNLTENGIKDGYTYTLTITNEHKKGNLVIYKVDADCNEIPLADVTFKIYDSDNNYVDTIKTDSNRKSNS